MLQTLVFVHGYLGGSCQWQEQVDFFSNTHKIIAIDLPGFGKKRFLQAPNSIKEFAEYVLAELTEREVENFHLLGHSMGGMIVQEIARLAPNRVQKLILYATGSIGILPGRFETIAESINKLQKNGVAVMGKYAAQTWFVKEQQAKNYYICADLVELVSEQAALAGLRAMETWSAEHNLSNITQQTLIIWGDKDRTYKWPQIEKMWTTIQHCSLAVVANCAHAVHLEKKDLFNSILQDFLNTHSDCPT